MPASRSLVAACGTAACALLFAGLAGGQASEPAPAPSTQAPAATVLLRANTLVPLRMLDTVSSATGQIGDRFRLVVTDDIFVDDTLVVPAGSAVEGEVIH